MGLFLNNDKDDNGVEVVYTGKEIYHLSDDDGTYDAKISEKSDGSVDLYETESDWDDHSHVHMSKEGETIYDRPEGQKHSWEDRFKD